jgi:3-deoxy-7-phosphoheptulonate synthase
MKSSPPKLSRFKSSQSKACPSEPCQSKTWFTESWQTCRLSQQAHYADINLLDKTIQELSQLPPLVSVQEIEDLKTRIASAAKGECFVLQGGDCAELFSDCNAEAITDKLKILLQMSLILVYGLNQPVVKIGRMAGQYAKPRSAETETINGLTLPCYRGDLINGAEFNKQQRTPDPERLLKGYSFASLTLNYLRTLLNDHFADLSNVDLWDLDFIAHSSKANEYHQILDKIKYSQSVIENITLQTSQTSAKDKIYTCHEALHLHYEQALTRKSETDRWYNLSTHMPWIGMRTSQLDSAHVEYMRGIENPIAIKIGPSMSAEHLLALVNLLDPDNTPGRLTLITRFGEQKISQLLPPMIDLIQKEGKTPLWCCDPMHGNTSLTEQGRKTRRFEAIISELTQAFEIHQQKGSHLGGLHIELTGENVTECVGGARGLTEFDLKKAYKSLVDPRLNAEQSLEMAILITQLNQKLTANSFAQHFQSSS